MAQTAVEQLIIYMNENFHLTEEALYEFKKAKQMEKVQIEKAFDIPGDWQSKYSDSEDYYNQTYTTRLQNETN